MKRRWDIQFAFNPWLSLGVHVDHKDPSVTLHLPGLIVYAGKCKQPGFRPYPEGALNADDLDTVLDRNAGIDGAGSAPCVHWHACASFEGAR